MIGCRPLNEQEIELLDMCFIKSRERLFFRLCMSTGMRPSEALSLKVRDVLDQERVVLQRRHTKGKVSSGSILLHPNLMGLIKAYVLCEGLSLEDPLFKSREGGAISRTQMYRDVKRAVRRANLKGLVALHTARKIFAEHMYEHLNKDLVKTSKALRHRNINSTVSYLSFKTEEMDEAILAMPIVPWPK